MTRIDEKALDAAGLVNEGLEILNSLIDNIKRKGNYSPESTCMFLDQAGGAFREALSALEPAPAEAAVPAEKITSAELGILFPCGVPMVAMKILFPEKSAPLTASELRTVLEALARSPAPAEAEGWRAMRQFLDLFVLDDGLLVPSEFEDGNAFTQAWDAARQALPPAPAGKERRGDDFNEYGYDPTGPEAGAGFRPRLEDEDPDPAGKE